MLTRNEGLLSPYHFNLEKIKNNAKKCFKAKVTNELINKDGNYFCGNECESDYWGKFVKAK